MPRSWLDDLALHCRRSLFGDLRRISFSLMLLSRFRSLLLSSFFNSFLFLSRTSFQISRVLVDDVAILPEGVVGIEVFVGGVGGVGSMRMHGAASVVVCGFNGGVGGVGGIVFLVTRGSFGGGSQAQDID